MFHREDNTFPYVFALLSTVYDFGKQYIEHPIALFKTMAFLSFIYKVVVFELQELQLLWR